MYRIQKQVTTEALMMFKRDRRREIDEVIDYFGEWREAPAARPRAVPGTSSGCIAWSNRFPWATGNEVRGFPGG